MNPTNAQSFSLQSGDLVIPSQFYHRIFPFIENGHSILNLGSGLTFSFEKAILQSKEVKLTAIDLLQPYGPYLVPENVQFLTHDIEKPILLSQQFDRVTFFEVIEHIDHTDELLKNCHRLLKENGKLIFSFPNLSSYYSRIELLLGLQPHILEVSNEKANFGTGLLGRFNNPTNTPIHHIRGITHQAMKEMVEFHGFTIEKILGYDRLLRSLLRFFPALAPINFFVCRKSGA